MAELVDVILHAPSPARLAHEIGPHLRRHDLVGAAGRSMRQHGSIEIDDHRLAHGIEGAVGATHADIGRHHQIAECVRLVGEAPGLADGRRVAGGADHHLGTLVGALARHLREHAVVADDQRQLAALGPVDNGNAEIARFPRLDRHPGMHLAVVELQLALVVDDDAGIVGHAAGVELHDGEAAPDVVVAAGLPERRDLRPVEAAHDLRIGVHGEPVQRVFGKDHKVHRAHVAARLGYHRHDDFGLRCEIGLRCHVGKLELDQPDHDPVCALVQSAQSVHSGASYLVIDNSPGAPASERPGDEVAIMMTRVRM
jgi:hypothetical protein